MKGAIYLVRQVRLPSGKDLAPAFEQMQADEIWQAIKGLLRYSVRNRYWVEWRREPIEPCEVNNLPSS